MDKERFTNIHVWPKTKKLLKTLANIHGLKLCQYLDRLAMAESLAMDEYLEEASQ